MKRFVTFFLICILTVYSTTICYAWNSALTGEQSQTDFGIYAIYIAGETEYLTSPVKKGKAEIQLPDGRRIVVSGVTDNSLTLVVYPITSQDTEAWEWFAACLEGKGKNISPFEIYFTDKKGNRIAVDGVTISLSDALKNSSAFSLNSKGTLKTLSVQSRNGQMIFQADGSYYYILAEKTEQDIPNEPTTQPTTQTGADNSTDVNHAGSGAASGAKTGDDTPLELYMVLLFVGLITTSIAGLCRKKNYVAKQK